MGVQPPTRSWSSTNHPPLQETLGLGESARPPPPKTLRALGTRPVGLRLSLPNGSDTVANSVMQKKQLVFESWKIYSRRIIGWWRFKHNSIVCMIHKNIRYISYIIDINIDTFQWHMFIQSVLKSNLSPMSHSANLGCTSWVQKHSCSNLSLLQLWCWPTQPPPPPCQDVSGAITPPEQSFALTYPSSDILQEDDDRMVSLHHTLIIMIMIFIHICVIEKGGCCYCCDGDVSEKKHNKYPDDPW